jgi:hypothetical protein
MIQIERRNSKFYSSFEILPVSLNKQQLKPKNSPVQATTLVILTVYRYLKNVWSSGAEGMETFQ